MDREGLNLRQRKFVNAYIANGGNAGKAYREAGYECANRQITDTMGCKLLRNAKIEVAVDNQLALMEKAAQISFERKVSWLADISEDGMKKTTVTSDPESTGRTVVLDKMQDSRASIAAISELNRMQGHHAATNTNLNISQVSFNQNIGVPSDLGSDEKPIDGEVVS